MEFDGEFDGEGYDEDYGDEGFDEDSGEDLDEAIELDSEEEVDLETDEAIPEEDIEGLDEFPTDDEIMQELHDEWNQEEYEQHLNDMARAELGIDLPPEEWRDEVRDEVAEEIRHEVATDGYFKDPGWALSEADEDDKEPEKEREDNLKEED